MEHSRVRDRFGEVLGLEALTLALWQGGMQMESLDEEEEDGKGLLNSDLDPRLTKINGAV